MKLDSSVNVCIASVLSVLQSPLYTLTLFLCRPCMRNRLSNADSLTFINLIFSSPIIKKISKFALIVNLCKNLLTR